MRDVLIDLNQEVGVKGSAILLRDGVLVQAEMGPPLNADVVAAVASSTIQLTNNSLNQINAAPFSKFVFNAAYGKMVFFDTGDAYLVVVLEKHINTDMLMLSIQSAARKIRSLGSMT